MKIQTINTYNNKIFVSRYIYNYVIVLIKAPKMCYVLFNTLNDLEL